MTPELSGINSQVITEERFSGEDGWRNPAWCSNEARQDNALAMVMAWLAGKESVC